MQAVRDSARQGLTPTKPTVGIWSGRKEFYFVATEAGMSMKTIEAMAEELSKKRDLCCQLAVILEVR